MSHVGQFVSHVLVFLAGDQTFTLRVSQPPDMAREGNNKDGHRHQLAGFMLHLTIWIWGFAMKYLVVEEDI